MLDGAGHQRSAGLAALPDGLTAREAEVLRRLARGLSTKEIAQALSVSPKTVDNQTQSIYRKIGAKSRTTAAFYAMEHRIFAASGIPPMARQALAALRYLIGNQLETIRFPAMPRERAMLEHVGLIAADAARRFGDREALVFEGRTFSFRELDDLVGRAAAGLQGLGVGKGDVVSLYASNSWQWLVSYHAVQRLGAVSNPVNTMLTQPELEYVANDCGPRG